MNWRSHGVDVVAYQNRDLIYSDLAGVAWTPRCRWWRPPARASSSNLPVKILPLPVLPLKTKEFFGDGTGIGLRKDDSELKAAFDKRWPTCVKTAPTTKWRRNTSTSTFTVIKTPWPGRRAMRILSV